MDREFELLKQKAHSNIEQRKMFWTIQIVLGGGIAALLTNPDSNVKIGLLIVGVLLFLIFLTGIRSANRNLQCLFKEMRGLINDSN